MNVEFGDGTDNDTVLMVIGHLIEGNYVVGLKFDDVPKWVRALTNNEAGWYDVMLFDYHQDEDGQLLLWAWEFIGEEMPPVSDRTALEVELDFWRITDMLIY